MKRWFPAFSCLLFVLGFLASGNALAQSAAERNLQIAYQLFQNKQYASAAPVLSQICQASPGNHQARMYLGWSLLLMGQPELARPQIEYLYRLDAKNGEYVKLFQALQQVVSTARPPVVQPEPGKVPNQPVPYPPWLEKTRAILRGIPDLQNRVFSQFDLLLELSRNPQDAAITEKVFEACLTDLETLPEVSPQLLQAVCTVGFRLLTLNKPALAEKLAQFVCRKGGGKTLAKEESRSIFSFVLEALLMNGQKEQAQKIARENELVELLPVLSVKRELRAGNVRVASALAQALQPTLESLPTFYEIIRGLGRLGDGSLALQVLLKMGASDQEGMAIALLQEALKAGKELPEQEAVEKLITTPMGQCRLHCLKAEQAQAKSDASARDSRFGMAMQLVKTGKIPKALKLVGASLIRTGKTTEAFALMPDIEGSEKIWALISWISPLVERGEEAQLKRLLAESKGLSVLERSTLLDEIMNRLSPDQIIAIQSELISAVSPDMAFQVWQRYAAALAVRGKTKEALPALLKGLEGVQKDPSEVQVKVIADFLSASGTRELANSPEVLLFIEGLKTASEKGAGR